MHERSLYIFSLFFFLGIFFLKIAPIIFFIRVQLILLFEVVKYHQN